MPISTRTTRYISLASFLLLTLPCLTFLSLAIRSLFWLWPVDTAIRAIPLYLAIRFDALFYDGGELSEQLIPLWVALTGVLLWPLLALGIRPRIGLSPRWRKAILGYALIAVTCTIPAAWWVFTHTGYLF